ncbi:hypothetical protein LC605_31075 [Nostoc sp. CHAB 5836]|uniref:hypothetical protein n=1 Tax=Nostoc sp. CHAB 5836 TaxID=2780404 RepID=UPI001E5CDFEF|nr:hypothetical protein [Nostoc sp. CHAB 5836]MCC5619426.1 hypothetical protein [Nostoc sp. CHAB 5836]
MQVIEDWIAQYPNLLKQCEIILGKPIPYRTWHGWQKLVGACYPQGKRLKSRKYTDEQAQLFLCLAWFRRLFPQRKLTYRLLREYWQSNEYKIEEVFRAIASGNAPCDAPVEKLVALADVKKCCDAVLNRTLSRKSWVKWKGHLKIPLREKVVDQGTAALLVFIACWRHDHYKEPLPSVNRLIVMMGDRTRTAMSLDTASSGTQFHQWQMSGCSGKELPKYLAACGFKVSLLTLYKWGDYSQKKHYSVSELAQWRRIADEKRNGRAA